MKLSTNKKKTDCSWLSVASTRVKQIIQKFDTLHIFLVKNWVWRGRSIYNHCIMITLLAKVSTGIETEFDFSWRQKLLNKAGFLLVAGWPKCNMAHYCRGVWGWHTDIITARPEVQHQDCLQMALVSGHWSEFSLVAFYAVRRWKNIRWGGNGSPHRDVGEITNSSQNKSPFHSCSSKSIFAS